MRRFAILCVPLLTLALTPTPHLQAQSPIIAGAHSAAPAGAGATHAAQEAPRAPLKRPVTLRLVDAPLAQALEEIARSAGLNLGYPAELVPAGARVTLDVQGRPAGEVLATALRGTDLELRTTRSGHATLVRRPRGAPSQPSTGTVTGRVTSAETGAALAGASVRVEGTALGTLTDGSGNYRLEVEAGIRTIAASMIGHTPGRARIDVSAGTVTAHDFVLAAAALPLDEVIVTGTMIPTSVRAIPTPITVITAEQIQQRNYQRVDQIFRGDVPGAMAWDNGSLGYSSNIIVRGADAIASASTVKTFIDGIEVADARFLATIDPESIERIEITRGPQASTIYGSGATSGVMQIFTKKGSTESAGPRLEAKVSLGAVQSHYAKTTLSQDHSASLRGGSDAFSYNLGGSYSYRGEFVDEHFSRNPSLFGAARTIQGPLSAEFSTRYATKTFGWPSHPVFRDLGYSPWVAPYYQEDAISQATNGVRALYRSSDRLQHELTVGHDQTIWTSRNTRPRLRTPTDTLYRLQDSRIGKVSVGFNSSLSVPIREIAEAVVVAGFDQWTYEMSGYATARAPRTSGLSIAPDAIALSNQRYGNRGFFAQVRTDLWNRTFLTGGVRAETSDNYGEDLGVTLSPRIGFAQTFEFGGLTAKLRSAYGESTRPPAPHQRQFQASPTGTVLANAALGPERQVGGEAGVDLYLRGTASLTFTYYHQTAHDLIDISLLDATTSPRTVQYQNLGRVRNAGVEVQATYSTAPLRLSAQYSTIDSRVVQLAEGYRGSYRPGERMRGVPFSSAGFSTTLTPWRGTTVGGQVKHAGRHIDLGLRSLYGAIAERRFTGNTADYYVTYPAFTKADLSFTQAVRAGLSMHVSIDNLTNSRAIEQNDLFLLPGRITTVGFRATL